MSEHRISPRWLVRTQMGDYYAIQTNNSADHAFECVRVTSINNGVYPPPKTVVFNCPYILEKYNGGPILAAYPAMVESVSNIFVFAQ